MPPLHWTRLGIERLEVLHMLSAHFCACQVCKASLQYHHSSYISTHPDLTCFDTRAQLASFLNSWGVAHSHSMLNMTCTLHVCTCIEKLVKLRILQF